MASMWKSGQQAESKREGTRPTTSESQSQQRGSTASVSTEAIARRAYDIWERRGRPSDQSERHWLEAEAELRSTGGAGHRGEKTR
jgi:hypothetical protein